MHDVVIRSELNAYHDDLSRSWDLFENAWRELSDKEVEKVGRLLEQLR